MDVRLNISYEQVHRSQKVCVSRFMCIFFLHVVICIGNVVDAKHSGRPSTSDDTMVHIEEAITRSPSASTRRLSRELGILQSTVWKTLHYRLHLKAYHIQVLHHLEQEDYATREAVCADLV